MRLTKHICTELCVRKDTNLPESTHKLTHARQDMTGIKTFNWLQRGWLLQQHQTSHYVPIRRASGLITYT